MTRSRITRRARPSVPNLRTVERATLPAAVLDVRMTGFDAAVRGALASGAVVLLYDPAGLLPEVEVARRGDAYAVQADLPHRRWPSRALPTCTTAGAGHSDTMVDDMTHATSDSALSVLREGHQAFRANLDHALRRQAEVDANPLPQVWGVEHARDAVTRATVALAVNALATAMLAAGT